GARKTTRRRSPVARRTESPRAPHRCAGLRSPRSTVWAPGSDRKDSASQSPPCRFVSLSRVPPQLRETKHDAAIDEFRRTQPILYHFEFGGYAGSGASCVVALSGRDRPASTRLRSMFRRSWESGLGRLRPTHARRSNGASAPEPPVRRAALTRANSRRRKSTK